ncbi:hypothetical protein SAMN05444274_11220 [Mariniphaga anaerophila]|uniref:Uncharacterized protein n=1 Tax=Mariniphaga anaerophila TaxID=1484053 RepID=A0A1M5FEX9_9BACT|nr:hypothetical protein SAMN05444274_11220 [Mariniphaga anaerophila]
MLNQMRRRPWRFCRGYFFVWLLCIGGEIFIGRCWFVRLKSGGRRYAVYRKLIFADGTVLFVLYDFYNIVGEMVICNLGMASPVVARGMVPNNMYGLKRERKNENSE